jgi:aminomethyltransferase
MGLRISPLDRCHRALGAKMVDFGGWEMPLAYGGGTIAEHLACRNDSVVFDVSHLGTVRLEGPDAKQRLQESLTNDLDKIEPGRAQYTHLLDESGSVTDDIIVWWVDDERFDVMPNASNTTSVTDVIGGEDVTATRAVLAVQGREARECATTVVAGVLDVPHFGVRRLQWNGTEVVVAGTGYTGEDGVEIAVPAEVAPQLWDELLEVGITPAGLGARDTLRLEAGLPLHGHELGFGVTPLQAGLSWVIGWDKPNFRGKMALEAERATGVSRRLRGVLADGRQPLREGNEVLVDGEVIGCLTSGNYSPVLERGIGMGFLPPEVEPGVRVEIDVRGRRQPAEVVKLPFVAKK